MSVFLLLLLYLCSGSSALREKRQTRCSGNSFRCSNGQCIPATSLCDGAVDCKDRSDETQAVCSKLSLQCPAYAFRCAYGACVDKKTKCNGVQDCADNSDELLPECGKQNANINNSLCKKHEFSCNSGQCIEDTLVCDGYSNCLDGSDETITKCINVRCPGYSFQCAYGGCIDRKGKCDGKEDCKDGSDEDPELCKTSTPSSPVTTKPKPVPRPTSKPNLSGSCVLPEKPEGGKYDIVVGCSEGDFSSKCRKIPGTIVPSSTTLVYSCGNGYVLPESSKYAICVNGSWDPKSPSCQRLCQGLKSDSVDLTCIYHGDEVSCDRRSGIIPGTELRAKCKISYHPGDPSTTFTVAKCLADGTWDHDLFKCVPDCGIRNTANDVTPTIFGGVKTKHSEYPWHAGLFQVIEGKMVYICGGSIAHPKAILTAAHCVYIDKTLKKKDENEIKVAVGKYRSSWDVKEAGEQKFDVLEIIIQSRYVGVHNRYEQDIAILNLNGLIKLNVAIMPICFDRDESLGLYKGPNVFGTVVGWGKTETGKISDELLVARFPIYDFHACRDKFGNSMYFTYDKFCAGLDNGTSVEQGDSGGGLTFPRKTVRGVEQHFIYGIVSLKPTNSSSVAAFTNVTEHIEWIDKVLNAVQKNKH